MSRYHSLPRFEVLQRLQLAAIERGYATAEDLAEITGMPLDRARIAIWQYYKRGQLRRYSRGKYGPPLGCSGDRRLSLRGWARKLLREATRPVTSRQVMSATGVHQKAANQVLITLRRLGEAVRIGIGRYLPVKVDDVHNNHCHPCDFSAQRVLHHIQPDQPFLGHERRLESANARAAAARQTLRSATQETERGLRARRSA